VDLVKEAKEKIWRIQDNLKIAQSRQKSYVDKRRRPLVFKVSDHVYLNVSPMKGVNHFGVRGKLAPRYIGLFPILQQCGPVAYHLKLPEQLLAMHNVFHVSQLKNVFGCQNKSLRLKELNLNPIWHMQNILLGS
jgi:hypothetical protein